MRTIVAHKTSVTYTPSAIVTESHLVHSDCVRTHHARPCALSFQTLHGRSELSKSSVLELLHRSCSTTPTAMNTKPTDAMCRKRESHRRRARMEALVSLYPRVPTYHVIVMPFPIQLYQVRIALGIATDLLPLPAPPLQY